MNIWLCPSPELYHLYHRDEATVVITDIFRASTTMVTAVANGAEAIRAVASTDECESMGRKLGCLTAAERHVQRCAFADLGNDPLEYTPERVGGRRIVMTTTNGTRSLTIAQGCGARQILIGSMLNLRATRDYCLAHGVADLVVLAAGWQGQMSMEDCLYAGALAHSLYSEGLGCGAGDGATMMQQLWGDHCLELDERIVYMQRSEHYARLVDAGHADAVRYCLTLDSHPVVVGLPAPDAEWLVKL